MDDQETDELVRRAQANDPEAFAELMRRTSPSAHRLAVAILRDPCEAEDEVQNSYLKAWRAVGQFQREAKFSTWIWRIVTNQCLMRLRRLRGACFVYLDDFETSQGMPPTELPDLGSTPENELVETEMAGIVRREISRLPPILRTVVMLRDVNELSTSEVASRLSISVAAVKSRLLRARAELRNRLEKHCGTPLPA